ncbi:hypothetical protein N494_06085 [Clostridium botulinum A2B7 92]|uniref:zinc ribbon domain-containing protein n=1 Tax=Clostridium botulinum TaxID=1491 RepID=UPI0007E1B7DA|nr:hypothetical protein [Clostridium botulinum]KEJ00555.1 hypothetical protein N494_06085 [Clostridium botulinum A2B7 92]
MNFCPKCGFKLDGKDECTQCGFSQSNKIQGNNSKIENIVDTNEQKKNKSIKINESTNEDLNGSFYENDFKGKMKFIILGVVAAVLIIAYFLLNNHYSDPTLAVKQFKDSVNQSNLPKLEQVIYCDDARLKINDENTKVLIDYFKSNPSYLNEAMNSLQFQSSRIKENKLSLQSDKNSKEIFKIQKVGKNFILFPKYKIVINPGYVNISSKVKGVKVKLNNKEYCKADNDNYKKEIGPLMPGNYKLTAEFANDFTKKTSNKSIDLIKDNLKTSEIEVMPELKYVNIDSDVKNAKIYVNGKDTGFTVVQTSKFGPVDDTSVIYAVDKSNGKNLKTEDFKVGDNENVYLSFSSAVQAENDFKAQVYTLVNGYASNFAYAVNYNNFSYIESYLESGSQIYNAQKKVIKDIYAANITEDFLGLEILSFTFDKNTNQGTVVTKEIYDITKGHGNTSTKDFKNTYKFIRKSDGQLKLTVLVE